MGKCRRITNYVGTPALGCPAERSSAVPRAAEQLANQKAHVILRQRSRSRSARLPTKDLCIRGISQRM